MTDSLDFYSSQGKLSDPQEYASLLDDLPTDIGELCRVVQGLLIHIFWAERYGIQLSNERQAEVQLRSMQQMLGRTQELDARPLGEARPLDRKLVGNCRDFSLMLTVMLRHQHTPARARCGFGVYFLPDHFEDHWVCEYWNARQQRWVLVDAQLDEFQCDAMGVLFNPLDVPRDQFVVAGKGWRLCREGDADPDCFGIHDMHGLWFIRGNVVRDLAALNKMPLLPWDCWGVIDVPEEMLTEADLDLVDDVAAVTAVDEPDFDKVRRLYVSEERLTVPNIISTYNKDGQQMIELANL